MRYTLSRRSILILVAILLSCCGGLERDNPVDPRRGGDGDPARGEIDAPPPLQVRLPIPKTLLSVVDRIVAVLEGPGILPVEKELEISPLGPARCTMGALQAGTGRTLSIRGYDLQGELLFQGRQERITIAAGETTAVVIQLELTQALPIPEDGAGDDEVTADVSASDDSSSGDDANAQDATEAPASPTDSDTPQGDAEDTEDAAAAGDTDTGQAASPAADAEESDRAGD